MTAPKVAYLGPEGTYTHQAALQQFGASATLVAQKSIKDCFSSVETGEVSYSVVPFENSTNGQVALTYDLLRDWLVLNPEHQLTVAYEQFVAIHHCVLSHATDIKTVKKIYTHPQAWGQVTNWLHQHPELEKIDSSSTSKAAEIASVEGEEYAAIASEYASTVHDVPVLYRNIENIRDNTTRFLVLVSKKSEAYRKCKEELPQKFVTLVAFTVEHDDPGALASCLGTLTQHGISMTSINSRPSTTHPWHYVFFIEFWIDQQKDNLKGVMKEFENKCLTTKVLGTFPRSQRYYSEQSK